MKKVYSKNKDNKNRVKMQFSPTSTAATCLVPVQHSTWVLIHKVSIGIGSVRPQLQVNVVPADRVRCWANEFLRNRNTSERDIKTRWIIQAEARSKWLSIGTITFITTRFMN
jgi:hypothetical protein